MPPAMTLAFYRANAGWLGAGVLLTLASSFGQTYFIALFADRIMADYGLTDGEWGAIYTGATLCSAAALLHAGQFADRMRVAPLAALILVAFAAIAVGMALSRHPAVLVVLIFGLRFCGQGMISHVGITAMGRWFRAHRGRAVAIAGLGYSLGEALLPRLAALAEPLIGWRQVWLAVAVLLLAGFLPLVAWLSRHERHPTGTPEADQSPGLDGRHWTRGDVLRHWLFWALMPAVFVASFIGTVIFFQMVHIAEVMGWSRVEMTAAYPLYAATAVTMSLVAGWLADRFGPDRLLPVLLLPTAAGVAMIGPFPGIWAWSAALALAGMTSGIAHALWGALWAELFGTRHLGAIKAVASAFMVVGSAVGPGVTGLAIDLGVTFPEQRLWMTAAAIAISGLHVAVLVRLAGVAGGRPQSRPGS
jgi:MFS family permease